MRAKHLGEEVNKNCSDWGIKIQVLKILEKDCISRKPSGWEYVKKKKVKKKLQGRECLFALSKSKVINKEKKKKTAL